MTQSTLFFVTFGCIVLGSQGFADVAEFQDTAQDHPNLTHQYSFDGADIFERLEDRRGVDDLVEQAGGGASVTDIVYEVPGLDESSEAVTTFRPPPGDEFGGGANFRIPSISLGDAFSYEVIFRPGQASIDGGAFNLGYILANRIENDRGYFLFQGSAEQDADGVFGQDGNDLASVIGASFNIANENTLLETIEVGHWYYACGSYLVDDGMTTFVNYVADLTAGETTLSASREITVVGSYGRDFTGLSIGGRFDGPGEGFPGEIDEVNLYDDFLDEDDFQDHLDLLVGEPVPCPEVGDTHCTGLEVDGDGSPGSYTATATATDDSGDDVLYTFTAAHPTIDPPSVIGPQAENTATFDLLVDGDWLISIDVDDDERCADVADDARCAVAVPVSSGVGAFVRGDIDGNGTSELTDAVFLFNHLFLGGPIPPCRAAADPNLEGGYTITSGVYLLNFLFLGGPEPLGPFPDCGNSTEASDVALGCETPTACE